MNQPFRSLPKPNPLAASDIAAAAAHVESLLQDSSDPPSIDGKFPEKPCSPYDHIDVSDTNEVIEVIENVEICDIWQGLPRDDLDDDIYDGAIGGVVDIGTEYLAFYKSFRDAAAEPAPNRWGIFLIKRRCSALATDMTYSTGRSFHECLLSLVEFLYWHELYHYRFDAHCLQMESTGGLAIYRPYRRLVCSRPITEWYEESVANHYGLEAIRQTHSTIIHDYLRNMVACSPGAYATGIEKRQFPMKEKIVIQASSSFSQIGNPPWQALVKSAIQVGTSMFKSKDPSKSKEPSLSKFLQLTQCPVYWIDWIRCGRSVLVPVAISVAEIEKNFIKRYLAGTLDHKSDHTYYRIDNGEKIKLPNPHQSDLKNGELYNIIGKAGLTSSQFHKERQRTSVWRKEVPRHPVLPSLRNISDHQV